MSGFFLGIDRSIFYALNGSLHWGPIDAFMMMLSEVTHFYLPVGLVLFLLIWKGGPRGRAAVLLIVIALVASDQIASFVIKPLVDRLRPCHELAHVVVLGGCGGGKSFPSTHAFNSFAFMTVLAAFYPNRRWWYFGFAALIGYSRIHVGAHYPFDVACGAFFGWATGRAVLALWRIVEKHGRIVLVWIADWYHAMRRGIEWLRKRKYTPPIFAGVLLAIAFPPMKYGMTAAIGLIPLLFAIERMERRHWWEYFKLYYVAFFVFHCIANYWVGGWSAEADPFLEIACVALMLVHPLFLMAPMIGYAWVRRRLGLRAALVALPFLWTAFEYLHSIGDLGYPWLTLGNTQTYYTAGIQFIEYTGVYGASFLLVVQNVLIFLLIREWKTLPGPQPVRRMAWPLALVIASVVVPALYGEHVFRENDLHPVALPQWRVAVIQPNIDPWGKWTTDDADTQVAGMKAMSRAALAAKPDMLLWPETAIPYYIMLPSRRDELNGLHRFVDSCGVPLLTGLPDIDFYRPHDPHPADAKQLGDGGFTASFNSSTVIEPRDARMPLYHKMQLVPFGERTPFVDDFPMFADVIKWSVGLSGWSKGTDYTIFAPNHNGDTAHVYGMICYESVYPSLVRDFVRRGATMLTVITNDGWYGRSPGPVQHQQYAVLRAIENRRAIARCANTGISCFIDRFGAVDQRTPLFKQATIIGDCALDTELTFYTEYGDVLSWICCGVAALALMAGVVTRRGEERYE